MLNRNIATVATDLPTARVLANGSELAGQFAVQSIYTFKALNKIGTARLVLQDGSIADEDFPLSNAEELIPGSEIEIQLGYSSDEEVVFKGIVVKHALKSNQRGHSLLEVTIKDAAFKMTLERNNRYFFDSTDTEILEQLVSEYGLTPDIEAGTLTHAEMVQFNATDWDFVITRAEATGKLVLTDDGTVKVFAPQSTEAPLLDLAYGHNIVDFETEIDTRSQYSSVVTMAWDMANQELIESESADPGFIEAGNLTANDLAGVGGLNGYHIRHTGRLKSEELQSWSNARVLRSRLAKIRGRIRIVGHADIKPGDVVSVSGLGDRFNGTVVVSGVAHVFGQGSRWYTDLHIGFSQATLHDNYDNVEDHASAGLVPGVRGLQIGVVNAIADDPEGENRIQVRLPIMDPNGEGVWMRVSTLDAGDNRGTFFRPEVGDEVVVGFLNEDPRHPIVLGMLHSSAKPSPITETEENNEKGLVTRSEMKMLFDDDAVSVTIETPNGNKIVISEDDGGITLEDENGNSIVMDSNGITYDSPGDIVIKATGDVKIEGMNIDVKAQSSLKASGTSGAELSSSATAVLKGSLVQIN